MYCPKCGKEIRDDSVFCMFCGEKIFSDHNAPSNCSTDENDVLQNEFQEATESTINNIGTKSIYIIVLVLAVIAAVVVYKSASYKDYSQASYTSTYSLNSNTEANLEELTHQYAVKSMKIILKNSGISKYDHLGWYYPEIYNFNDGIHYSSSKLDYNDSDHTYTIGFTYDEENKPTVVYVMIDDSITLDDR